MVAINSEVFITFNTASPYMDRLNSSVTFGFLVDDASHREVITAIVVAKPATHVPIIDQKDTSSGVIFNSECHCQKYANIFKCFFCTEFYILVALATIAGEEM